MPTISLKTRFWLFLYSTQNIVGCVFALGGLVLLFLGIIGPYWLGIVAGLYVGGTLLAPRNRSTEAVELQRVTEETLNDALEGLVSSARKNVPERALELLLSIRDTVKALLPKLQELRGSGALSDADMFTITQSVLRYLPETLGNYLRLPKFYASMHAVHDGKTAAVLLVEQLGVLDAKLKEIADNAFKEDAQALVLNGQFLESKFSTQTFL